MTNSLSQTQYTIAQVLGCFSALLSMAGSALIIASILKRKKLLGSDTILHQLLFGLSVADVVGSFLSFTVGWAIPSDLTMGGVPIDPTLAPYAAGTDWTCSAWAFLYYLLGMVTCCYNFLISLYFWSCVRKTTKRGGGGANKDRNGEGTPTSAAAAFCCGSFWFKQVMAHSFAVLLPLVLTILPLYVKVPPTGSFVFNKYPMVCYLDLSEWGAIRIRAVLTLLLSMMSTGYTIALSRKVKANLRQSRKYTNASTSFSAATGASSAAQQNQKKQRWFGRRKSRDDMNELERRERRVANQAFWYLLAYLNSFAPVLIVLVYKSIVGIENIEGNEGAPGSYAVMLLMYFFGPLQGALNFIIFVKPRFQAWKSLLKKRLQQGADNAKAEASTRSSLNPSGDLAAAPAPVPTPNTKVTFPMFLEMVYNALFEEMPAFTTKKRRDTLMESALRKLPDYSALNFNSSQKFCVNVIPTSTAGSGETDDTSKDPRPFDSCSQSGFSFGSNHGNSPHNSKHFRDDSGNFTAFGNGSDSQSMPFTIQEGSEHQEAKQESHQENKEGEEAETTVPPDVEEGLLSAASDADKGDLKTNEQVTLEEDKLQQEEQVGRAILLTDSEVDFMGLDELDDISTSSSDQSSSAADSVGDSKRKSVGSVRTGRSHAGTDSECDLVEGGWSDGSAHANEGDDDGDVEVPPVVEVPPSALELPVGGGEEQQQHEGSINNVDYDT